MKYSFIIVSLFLVPYYLSQLAKPNECSTLGSNAPLEERDCQIFLLKKGFCCFLTVTIEKTDISTGDLITTKEHSCIYAPSKDPNERQNIVNSLNYLGNEILIECISRICSLSFGVFLLFITLLN